MMVGRCCYGPHAAIVVAAVGTLLCLGFSLTFIYCSAIINRIAANFLTMKPDSMIYDMWSEIPFEISVQMYLFNYTNTEEFLNGNGSIKPKVEEVGPYYFGAHLKKVFVNFTEPPFVNYRMIITFEFRQELSNGSLDDVIIVPNLLSLIPMQMVNNSLVEKLMDFLIKHYPDAEPPFVPVNVGDYLFYGHQDQAIKQAQEKLGFEVLPDGRFGLLYGQNVTDQGLLKMNTGAENPNDMFQIVEFNEHESMDYVWGDEYCGMINGSDGTMSWGLSKFDRLYLFFLVFKRSIYFDYVKEITFKGITLNQYEIPIEFYGDYNLNPDNLCYTDGNPDLAYATGVFYLGKALRGAGLYISNPHFAGGDYKLVEDIDGLNPMGEEHFSGMGIMPEFGAPLTVALRFQMSTLMKPNEGITQTDNWPTVLLPVMWGNATFDLPDDYAADVRKYYYGGMKLLYILLIVFIIISGLVGLAGIFCSYKLMFQFRSELRSRGIEHYFKQEEISITNEEKHEQIDE